MAPEWITRRRQLTSIWAIVEFLMFLGIYAMFVRTDRVHLGIVALLLASLITRWIFTAPRPYLPSWPFLLSVFILVALMPVTLEVSPEPEVTLPKVYGLLLGIFAFFMIASWVRASSGLDVGAILLVGMGIAFASLALVATDWEPLIRTAGYDRLPGLFADLPRSRFGGLNPNGVAGALDFFLPFFLSLLLARSRSPQAERSSGGPTIIAQLTPYLLWVGLGLSTITLLLTQSRGGYIGALVGVVTVLLLFGRRQAVVVIIGLGIALVAAILLWANNELVAQLREATFQTLSRRSEYWTLGWESFQSTPWTGVGIGVLALPREGSVLDPLGTVHVHNNLLQVAVDLGMFGLLAYVGLLASFIWAAVQVYQVRLDVFTRGLVSGLVGGMLAHQVFGITDAFILGTKPGLFMWLFIGLMAAIHRQVLQREREAEPLDI